MKIAVFCGSSMGNNIKYLNATKALGKFFAQNNIDVVYGGGKVGLMGAIADSVMENGGKVYGVIPEKLKSKELAHTGITELHVVSTMHERKAMMAELADAFVTLPGGAGTLEEIFEAWTWAQLGYHNKPCAFYNVDGFYDKLFELINNMCECEFLKPEYSNMLIKTDNKEELLEAIKNYKAPLNKW
ncbi:TIGR00730 family Rossman fold protein [Malaciobacter mytili]|uniref:Cytokinin riboside 5'-monophosphate phosphoribohydrolase n=1 Tax=Malaciobacter mytili LMG 24559 TaxID=1032238 RepID=A0AAX2AJD7_9BACT|nr:TIGR00730 family Rossman fold protein [Malaciobacter mytili]AXH14870.1 putative Rossmann fold nucleotide-binding protein [Malaciobacter mytili LMG 24559]RXI48032.1 TIGR00730 family Rossman fold protein [Malaciobacter mytili]RXK16760.1 TIGR00730 family Rossman fold protein [Malaciobacter mytili LMG 24559]